MQRHHALLIASIAAMAFTSQAQAQTTSGGLTREQVRAAYFQARDQGRLPGSGELGDTQQVTSERSTVTRAQVLQELSISGPAPSGEGADAGAPFATRGHRTRAEVHAEAVRAVRDGSTVGGEV